MDGILWSIKTPIAPHKSFIGIVYLNNTYFASGNANDEGKIFASEDLVHWIEYELENPDIHFVEFYSVNGQVMAYGLDNANDNKISNHDGTYISSDGINWQKIDTLPNDEYRYSYYYLNNEYIAAGSNGRIYTSKDTKTWRDHNILFGPSIKAMAYGNGEYVMLPANKMEIWTSKDLVIWNVYEYEKPYTFFDSPVTYSSRELTSVVFDGTKFVVTGYDSYGDNSECHAVVLTTE